MIFTIIQFASDLNARFLCWALSGIKTDDVTLLFQAKALVYTYLTSVFILVLFAVVQISALILGIPFSQSLSLSYFINLFIVLLALWIIKYGYPRLSAFLLMIGALYAQFFLSWRFGGLTFFFMRGNLVIQVGTLILGVKGVFIASLGNLIGASILCRWELAGVDMWLGEDPHKRITDLYLYGMYFVIFNFLFSTITSYVQQNLIISLQEANKHKSNFLSKVSHEIRTPLAGIIGTIDILSTTTLNNDQMSLLTTAKNCSQTLMEIINDVLDLSKIELGAVKINLEKVELRSLIENCIKIVSPLMNKKNLAIVYRIQPIVPQWIITDPLKLKQILINLLSNAIKVTDNGMIGISVSLRGRQTQSYETIEDFLHSSKQSEEKTTEMLSFLHPSQKKDNSDQSTFQQQGRQRAFSNATNSHYPQVFLKFSVIDSGIGIEKEKIPTLFEPFNQLISSEKRSEGTGLGLAIAKQLIEKLGGSIHVYSGGIGKGSTFYFFLPCVPCLPDSQSSESSSIESLSSLNSSNGHSMKLQETWSQKSNDKTTAHSDTSLVTSPSEFPQFHLNILVVEDNEVNQMIICRLLQKFGCRVDVVSNGQEAVEILKRKPHDFHLVLMDLEMPVLNGLEATKIIRNSLCLKIPIIALSAHALVEHENECLVAGMQALLRKPLSIVDLQRTLQQITSQTSDQSELRKTK